jgi:hypothetical protein
MVPDQDLLALLVLEDVEAGAFFGMGSSRSR